MKKINKICLCLLSFLMAFFVVALQIDVFASDTKFSSFGATYQIKEIADEYDFGYGITYQREISTSSVTQSGLSTGFSLNVDSAQQAHVLTVKPSEDVLLVPYTFVDGGQWHAVTVKKAALQYEATHPGYKVVAAVNGDFFNINSTYEALGLMVQDGDVIRPFQQGPSSWIGENDGVFICCFSNLRYF